jgi:hypothetical protein
MRGVATEAHNGFGNGFSLAAGNGFERFAILPKVVFKHETIIMFLKFLDNREFVGFKLLVSGRV